MKLHMGTWDQREKEDKYCWDILASMVGTMFNEEKGNYEEDREIEERVQMFFKPAEFSRLAICIFMKQFKF